MIYIYMGLSENVVSTPKNPMVFMVIIPFLNGYFIGGIPHFQTNPYVQYMCLTSSMIIKVKVMMTTMT